MSNLRTRRIGELFEYEGILLEVVNARSCAGCFFDAMCNLEDKTKPEIAGFCSDTTREDHASVKFVPVLSDDCVLKEIDKLLIYATNMEDAYAGKMEEEFYSGMIHGLNLMKLYIKRRRKHRNS